jgi:hypothetical protein
VVDAASGRPVRHFRIFEVQPRLQEGERAGVNLGFGSAGKEVNGEDGIWRSKYPSKPGTLLGVLVQAKGYAPGIHRRLVAAAEPDPDAWVIRLHEGATIRGTVRDAVGRGVAKAMIYSSTAELSYEDGRGRYFSAQATGLTQTDSNGDFVLVDAPTGDISLIIKHADWPVAVDGPFAVRAEAPTTRQIALTPSAVIEGTLVDAVGKPIAGAELRLTALRGAGFDYGAHWQHTTSAVGAFRFAARLGSGTYHLDLPYGNNPLHGRTWYSRTIQVAPGGVHKLTLAPAGRCELEVTIHGTDTGTDTGTGTGTGTADAYIRLTKLLADGKNDPSLRPCWLGVPAGHTVLRGIPAGRYRVTCNLGKGDAKIVEVVAGRRGAVELSGQE